MGHLSPTGAGMLCPQGRVDLLAGGRAWWRRVLPLLRDDERLRHWCTPQLLRVPGTDAVVLAELAQLWATLEALATTASVEKPKGTRRVRKRWTGGTGPP